MANRTFNIPRRKDPSKVTKILDAIDIGEITEAVGGVNKPIIQLRLKAQEKETQ